MYGILKFESLGKERNIVKQKTFGTYCKYKRGVSEAIVKLNKNELLSTLKN